MGSKFLVYYRDIGTDFAPKYRQEPIIFEDVIADQRGYTVRSEQCHIVLNVNIFCDDIKRKTDSLSFLRTLNYGVGYLGAREMELKLNREVKREKYRYPLRNIDRNEKVESIIIIGKYNFFYPVTPGIRFPLTLRTTFREDKIYHPDTGGKYTALSLQIELNYRLTTDWGFSVSYKTTT